MIFSVLLDGLLHETGKGGKDVDGRIDLLVVQLSIDEDLSLGDVSSKVGNGMGDVIVLIQCEFTGIERIGIWVIEPFLPWTRPALS